MRIKGLACAAGGEVKWHSSLLYSRLDEPTSSSSYTALRLSKVPRYLTMARTQTPQNWGLEAFVLCTTGYFR